MKEFSCKTKIVTGEGCLSCLGGMGIEGLFLVTDPYFYKNGTAQQLVKLSGAKRWEIFHKVVPDPSVALAAEGTALLRKFDPDTVVALGGGSTMDCAKAMVYFGEKPVRLIAVPTTSGSGSEVTDFAILTHGEVKHPLVDERLRPHVAILDSQLLEKLPPSLVADTGFDVLCHALEAYTARNATALTDAMARDAFQIAFSRLPASYGGNTGVRLQIHEASTMAGLAFTHGGLGLCHAMAHALGGAFHIPHGRLNAILLPAVMDWNCSACGGKYAQLARAVGLGATSDTVAVRNLKNSIFRLRRELGMPATLREAGAEPRQVWEKMPKLVADTLSDACCKTNPVTPTADMVKHILEAVTGGK